MQCGKKNNVNTKMRKKNRLRKRKKKGKKRRGIGYHMNFGAGPRSVQAKRRMRGVS